MNEPRRAMPGRVRLLTAGTALACAFTLMSPPLGATAADPKDQKRKVDREIAQLKEDLHETSADLSAAYIALRRTQAALPAAQAKLDRANAALAKADQHNDAMALALQVARANEARAVDALARTDAEIADTRARVAHFAAQMYQDQGMGQLSVALSATSPDDFATKIAMADTVMSVQNKSLDRLSTVQAAATAQKAHVEALRRDSARAKVAAEKALKAAAGARAQASAAKVQLDRLAAQQKAQAARVAARKAAEQRRLTGMQAESNRLKKVLAARARAAKIAAARARAAREAAARAAARKAKRRYVPPPPPAAKPSGGFLSAPSNAPVSSEYGMRYHPVLNYWRLHAGRDYANNCGTPIFAAASGTIISAGVAGGYGNQLVVDHGVHSGVSLVTTYNHLSDFARTGGHVGRGQVIGYAGTTGTSTGCHLHFETREDGNPVDPRKWL
ncbi:M23 family metallopeptidase [Knoellia sp. p5-6-4]|uniref:M23 family metallopeptidase n=1 Tax=unclassified Knoellia TaxID=2618719 RepID=UPI0023DCB256|nr:M23 family metallopeptidase [Knoellia sp. p5-6-4]MDF2146297.1 peptidoglycan DD-metalloendopeptidase family protein [Knoellia sp. p5-6-4]